MTATSAPAALAAVGARVAARVDSLLAAEQARWSAVQPALDEPLRSLRDLVGAAGKRLRPAFCFWAFVGCGGHPDSTAVIDAGAALELLHTFALIQDDIMDDGDRRRGLPCLHAHYSGVHAERQWRGEARRFGEGAAILIADLAFVYADLLLASAPPAVVDVFTDLRLEVNIGQYLDLVGTATGAATVEQARTICVYKTGKYTVERPLHLGAALAGRLDELAPALTAFGVPLGEAFQLRDDLLGAFGEGALVGKGIGDDFRGGKPTALFALARQRASGRSASLLEARFGQPDLADDEVAAIQTVMVETGARSTVEEMIDGLVGEALRALAAAPLTAEANRELTALALFVAGRDH